MPSSTNSGPLGNTVYTATDGVTEATVVSISVATIAGTAVIYSSL